MTNYTLVSTVKNRDEQLDAELAELEKKPEETKADAERAAITEREKQEKAARAQKAAAADSDD